MTDLAKMKADAEAAQHIDHNEHPDWYDAGFFNGAGAGFRKNAIHIANCSPQTILKLLAVVEAARGA